MDRSPFKIIVLHEDLVTGIRASAMLKRLVDQFHSKSEMETEIWKFDTLRNRSLWEQAAAQGIGSDMILIAVGSGNFLPDHLKDWIENVLFQKQGGQPSVLVLLNWQMVPGAESSTVEGDLRQQAEKYGVDFLCNTSEWRLAAATGPTFSFMNDRSEMLAAVSPGDSRRRGANDWLV